MIKKLALVIAVILITGNLKATGDKLFPDIPGWKTEVSDRVYTSDDLWELINGAADIFLSYDFLALHSAEYTRKDQIIRVELYRHKTNDDTYGIYSAERMPDYPQVKAGAQGYKSQGVLNFFTGNYYVKVMSAGTEEADEETIALVAGKVDAQLSQQAVMPEMLKLFPEEGQVSLSDSYIARNFMGYSFFHHAFTVKYDRPAGFQMFLIRLKPDEIQKMVGQYAQLIKEDKLEQRDGILIFSDPFNGKVFLKTAGEYMVGIMNTDNEAVAKEYIGKTLARINR